MKRICELMEIPRGMTAVVGSGGKTSLIARLAGELSDVGRVLWTTSTRIRWPQRGALVSPTPEELERAFGRSPIVVVGTRCEPGQLGAPTRSIAELARHADFTLVEADVSGGLPVKAPDDTEPMLVGGEALVIAVAGMRAVGRPIRAAAQHPERYAALVDKCVDECIELADMATVLLSPLGQRKGVTGRFAVALNQCDTPHDERLAARLGELLRREHALMALRTRPGFAQAHSYR